jgi:hypothetical protein
MRRFAVQLSSLLFWLSWLSLAACAHLPVLRPVEAESAKDAGARCQQAFPAQPWHATHTIFASLPFGQNSGLIGATAAESGALHAVLVSPEGVTLFNGTQRGGAPLTIDRAVPPFDRPDFAASLMADVGNAYLSPTGSPTTVGTYVNGATVCRWSPPGGEITDVELTADGPRAIRTFRGVRLSREILLLGPSDKGFYPLVVLRVPGTGGYQLEMRLIEHE